MTTTSFTSMWKFPIGIDDLDSRDRLEIALPAGAEILHVAPQGTARHLEFWARVAPGADLERRTLRVAGTGHSLSEDERYIGTSHSGFLVWHLFEVLK